MAPLLDALTGDPEIAALFLPDAEIAALLRVEAALARAQGALGAIEPADAARIEAAVADFEPDEPALRQGLARDGVVVPELVRQLREAAGEAGPHVHVGATSQDIIDTGLMLRLRTVLAVLATRLDAVLAEIARLDAEEGGRTLMAQTRMQAALPFTAADKLATWARPLQAHRERLRDLAHALPIQLGGPVGNGASFGASYERLRADIARHLDLRDAAPWHSDRTPILDVAQGLALVTGTLGKIGQDLALLAQNEVGAVKLSGGGGSSAMAHKQNPVGAEVLVALARFNAGLLGTLSQSMVHENERSGAAWTLEWLVLPQMAEATGRALTGAADLLRGARFAD
ncbi:3-carboxy-cis,cis-muconate cycloisomerase [Aureimonas sp. Leaf324]|uniref:3-carboxy-cis,cis-muconate cycloisomerase n=1 Tax=Aureimonas sp. Leaf324 TaxID=1736336 RepID=UPI0006F420A7|nr:3-carboxy-cis,cis-muconate cycloisomerase [Aureimonas sp. Leaf324]KQQ89426.1 3-carboxy-cis,cis-muconate cycloisomerase [Aureimonas sp. Leaf324]